MVPIKATRGMGSFFASGLAAMMLVEEIMSDAKSESGPYIRVAQCSFVAQ